MSELALKQILDIARYSLSRDQETRCNCCGLSCTLTITEGGYRCVGGLIGETVVGGYESTAGNGFGALDDNDSYTFSMCEWCLDWLFAQFKVPPRITNYEGSSEFKPSAQRVDEDGWRGDKAGFYAEKLRRDRARGHSLE